MSTSLRNHLDDVGSHGCVSCSLLHDGLRVSKRKRGDVTCFYNRLFPGWLRTELTYIYNNKYIHLNIEPRLHQIQLTPYLAEEHTHRLVSK